MNIPLASAVLAVGTSTAFAGAASFSFTTPNGSYSQNFNALGANAGSQASPLDSNPALAGIVFSETGTSNRVNTAYDVGTGTSATADTYNYASSASATDRAFGTLLSSTLTSTIGFSFANGTDRSITSLAVAYRGELYRLGTSGRADRLDFQYSTNASSLTTGA